LKNDISTHYQFKREKEKKRKREKEKIDMLLTSKRK